MKSLWRLLAVLLTLTVLAGGITVNADGDPANPPVLGDLDGTEAVDQYDVLRLVYHLAFDDEFPIGGDADFTLDHKTDADDALYLLYHTFFPVEYPLESTPVKLWVPLGFTDVGAELLISYNRTNPNRFRVKWEIEEMNEAFVPDAVALAGEDAGDLFFFSNEGYQKLYRTGCLDLLPPESYDAVVNGNSTDAVKSVTCDGVVSAYPVSTSFGYYLYYDKRVVSAQDAESLASILSAVEAAGKKFEMDLMNPWYLASFFFGAGCSSEWVMDDEGHFVNVIDSFNSEEGAIAARAAVDLMNSAAFVAGDSVEDLRNIAGAVVADSFSYFRASDILGENLGVAKMPSFTAGGTSYPMSFYDSAWLMGVRSGETPERQTILHDVSRFLSGEAAQEILFDELEWLPTNLNCRSLAKVLETEWMLPLIEGADQAVPQGAIFGGWWGVASEFAADLANADTDAKILEALQVYEDKLYGLIFELTDPSVREAYTAIGFLDGTYFDVDFRMKETDGIWETEKAFDMAAGTEFRVRKGMSWEVAYPENNANYVVGTSGLYYIRFDPATGAITLRDASQEEIDVTL